MLAAVVVCFVLVREKKSFGDVAIRGVGGSMVSVLIIAFMLAGILSKLLRGSGLVSALVWLCGTANLDAGFIPLIAFLVCALISTSCGTSSGSIVAVLPVILPTAIELGCDASLVTGAVISGALFGDNLAPISDTTIASALTQESTISDVVRTRLPYSLIAGGISAVLFLIFGKLLAPSAGAILQTGQANPAALVLLIIPVAMVILMRRGWNLGGTLIICDTLALIIDLGLGLISPAGIFGGDGALISGIMGMIDIIVFTVLLFIVIQAIRESGALTVLGEALLRRSRNVHSVELTIMAASILGTVITAGSSTGILFAGPITNDLAKKYDIAGTRAANILDASACATCGFVPICTPYLISLPIALELAWIPDNFSYFSILKYVFHPMLLIVVFLVSILTGKGRLMEKRS